MLHLQSLELNLGFFYLISQEILFKIQYIGQSKLFNVMVILPITFQYFINDFLLLLHGERCQKHYFLESKGPYKVKMLCKIIFYHQANSLQFSEHLWKSCKSMVSLCMLSNPFIQHLVYTCYKRSVLDNGEIKKLKVQSLQECHSQAKVVFCLVPISKILNCVGRELKFISIIIFMMFMS